VDCQIRNLPAAVALPRVNGELVFEEPWQGRAFGMVIALHRAGLYDWDDFRTHLVRAIAANDARASGEAPYYESWLSAFERLLMKNGVIEAAELVKRQDELRSGLRNDVF
jgi:nitrile hydratase accessory protein